MTVNEFHPVHYFGNDQTEVLGTIIFNFAYVVTIPSWCNEKVNTEKILSIEHKKEKK